MDRKKFIPSDVTFKDSRQLNVSFRENSVPISNEKVS